jgi:hypothetical protein
MFYKFSDFNVNESYKTPKEYVKNIFGFNVPVRTYIDDIFDYLVNMNCDINKISEKDFKNWDKTKEFIETYFDNNDDIILEINEFKEDNSRYQYCAEYIYDKYFNLPKFEEVEDINEKNKYTEIKNKLKRIRKIDDDLKQKISHFLNSKVTYKNGVFFNLTKPNGLKTKMKGVGFGADRNGFFVYTHRARSKSYIYPENIPDKIIKYIESTG